MARTAQTAKLAKAAKPAKAARGVAKPPRAAKAPKLPSRGPAYTVTFGSRAENHAGMKVEGEGEWPVHCVSAAEIRRIAADLRLAGIESDVVDLRRLSPDPSSLPEALVLVVPGGAEALVGAPESARLLFDELETMPRDSTFLSYGKVKNKHVRHNLTIGNRNQEPDIANGVGTIVRFDDHKNHQRLRLMLAALLKVNPEHVLGEVNAYHNSNECGIGFHGDVERGDPENEHRGFTAGVRLGAGANGMPLNFVGYFQSDCITPIGELILNDGDLYIMDEKAMGGDFKMASKKTYRHSAGHNRARFQVLSGTAEKKRKAAGAPPTPVVRLYG